MQAVRSTFLHHRVESPPYDPVWRCLDYIKIKASIIDIYPILMIKDLIRYPMIFPLTFPFWLVSILLMVPWLLSLFNPIEYHKITFTFHLYTIKSSISLSPLNIPLISHLHCIQPPIGPPQEVSGHCEICPGLRCLRGHRRRKWWPATHLPHLSGWGTDQWG